MWTATLTRADKEHGRLVVEILYEDQDSSETFQERYNLQNPTRKQIRDLARREVARLDAIQDEVIDLPIGASINIDPDVVPEPPAPTAAEIARADWFSDWNRLNKLIRLANGGLIAADDSRITTLQTSLVAAWDNSYLDGV